MNVFASLPGAHRQEPVRGSVEEFACNLTKQRPLQPIKTRESKTKTAVGATNRFQTVKLIFQTTTHPLTSSATALASPHFENGHELFLRRFATHLTVPTFVLNGENEAVD